MTGDDGERIRTGQPASRAAPAATSGPLAEAAARAPAAAPSAAGDVADFLRRVKEMPVPAGAGRGRLVFAMDATMSRQPTWDMALALQAEMFSAVKAIGGLDVQLVYFRGAGECRASRWVADPDALARLMTTVDCRGGYTQIGKVLAHARQETEKRRISAMVYVGDAMEEEADDVCGRAGELALLGVPVFAFQEGHDAKAERTLREIARLTGGAFCRFEQGAADQLRQLLAAVAVYAAGGRAALLRLGQSREGAGARLLLEQMKPR